jgi:protein TonB
VALAGGELAALPPAPPAAGPLALPEGPDSRAGPGVLGGSGSGAAEPPPPATLEAALAEAGLALDGPGSPWLAEQRREIVRRVQARVNEEPYPGLDALRTWTGVVRVAFVIRRDGRVARVRVVGSSGHSQLDEAALRAVRAASPLPRPPRPQAVELSVVFRLD